MQRQPVMKVLALDFDGVVCDSVRECFATALAAYEAMTPDSPLIGRIRSRCGEGRWHSLDLMGDPVAASFENMMPLGNRAEDFGISLAASENFLELMDQSAYDTFAATVDPAWIDAFHAEFYEQRAAARAFDHHGWLDLHAPYPFFSEILRRRSVDTTVALATAKDRRSAGILLEHLGLGGIVAPGRVEHSHRIVPISMRRFRVSEVNRSHGCLIASPFLLGITQIVPTRNE